MNAKFDPYYDWLGIPPADQPPHHYRLFGLQALESNPRVIENAADRLMTQLRGFAAGPNGAQSQKLLNEVAAARACLLDEKRKAAYDKPLRDKLAAAAPKPQVKVQPVYVQVPVPVPVPTALPPMPSAAAAPPPPAEANPSPAPAPFQLSTSRSSSRNRGGSTAGGTALGLIKVVMGGLGGLSIAVLGVWIFFRSDPLGIFKQPTVAVAANTTAAAVKPEVSKPAVKPEQLPATIPASKPATPVTAVTKPANPTSPETKPPVETPDPRPLPGIEEPQVPEKPMPVPAAERRQPPTSDEQQAKLAELKELYKTEFDSGLKPAGREAFVGFLLETTEALKSDPVARFVLLREAYSRLVQLKDFPAAAEVIDRLEGEFVMDPFKLRLHMLTEASPTAKLPADRLAIVSCASELVELAMARQRIEEADKLVRIAEGQARALNDTKLRARMTALRLEVEKLAERWAPVERARKALAANPADAAAALIDGKHRCLVQGDWKAGLELLAGSNDPALAAAAKQDLAGPTAEFTAGTIADAWYDIARAGKELENFYARARHWYKQVPATGETLDQARVQKRIEQIEALNLPSRLLEENATASTDAPLPSFAASYNQSQSFEPVDLLQHVQRQDLAASPWGATTEMPIVLYSDDETTFGRLPVRYAPPREYQLTLRVRRGGAMARFDFPRPEERAAGPFVVGLVGPKGPFLACFDLPAAGGEFATFISIADVQSPAENPTYRRLSFTQIPSGFGNDATIICQVRRKSVTIQMNGNEVCRYEGDLARLALPKEWSVGDPKVLFIGSHLCGYSVSGWSLEPLPAVSAPPAFNAAAEAFGPGQGG